MRGKEKVFLCILFFGLLISGCGNNIETEDGKSDAAEQDEIQQDEIADAEETEGIVYTCQEISLTFPMEWKDRYVVVESEDGNGISVFQKASYDKGEGYGFLFAIGKEEEPVYDMPGEQIIAYTENAMYIITYPTDVPYYEDSEIAADYHQMSLYLDSIEESVQIDAEGVHDNPEEYVLPMSEYYPLQEDLLWNFDDNQLMLARNEIYARHGYHFENDYLNYYFDRYSWYEDLGEQFDESQLSQVEKDNLEVIRGLEEKYAEEHPYPKEFPTGETISADLDGDGWEETLSYQVKQIDEWESRGILTINHTDYDLYGMADVYMENPDTEHFYLTDISPYFDGLEIAVTEEGSSDDPMTHFYIYDGDLIYIGSVSGYPMKQKGNRNGFHDGGVTGEMRQGLIETYECLAYWWYDYDNQKLVYQDTGYFEMVPKPAHGLLVDLPVYTQMSEESPMVTLKAQDKVFFMVTDGKEWILVRGKDGTEGYIHITEQTIDNVDKAAEEVFTGLTWYD